MATARNRPDVSLDLDALDREGDPGPFSVRLGGRDYELVDAQQLDYRELLDAITAWDAGDEVKTLGVLLEPDDREAFWKNRIPAFKLEALILGYMEHYGIELSAGEAGASSPSSRGTAGRSRPISRSAA